MKKSASNCERVARHTSFCPRIDEPIRTKELAVLARSVKEEAKRLKKYVFPEYEIGILHSKMKDSEKEKVMNDFENGKNTIFSALRPSSKLACLSRTPPSSSSKVRKDLGLPSSTSSEVASSAGTHQAYCFRLRRKYWRENIRRVCALIVDAKNGFELAEKDLQTTRCRRPLRQKAMGHLAT